MAAENFEDRFYLRGTPAWHGLGKVVPESWEGDVPDAFKVAKADFALVKVQPYAIMADGQRIVAKDQHMLVREASHGTPAAYLGMVHRNYPVLQNMEIAEMLRPFGNVWKVETVGSLREGSHLFVTFRVGTTYVGKGGDEVREFWMFSERRDGQTPAYMVNTDVRVVCANTERLALSGGANKIRIPHYHSSFVQDVSWALETVAKANGIREEIRQAYNRMAGTTLAEREAEAIIAAVLTEPAAPDQEVVSRIEAYKEKLAQWEQARDRVLLMRSDVATLYGKLGAEFRAVQAEGTAWHLYNTFTQFAGTYKGRQVGAGVLFGDRGEMIERAGTALLDRSAAADGSTGRSVSIVVPALPQGRVANQPMALPMPATVLTPASVATPAAAGPATGNAGLTSDQKASNALKYLQEQRAAFGRPLTPQDVADDTRGLLRRAVTSYLVNGPLQTEAFTKDLQKIARQGRSLTDGQVKGATNYLTGRRNG